MHLKKSISTLLTLTVVLVQIIAFPSLSFAQEADSEPSTSSTASSEPAPSETSPTTTEEQQQPPAPPPEEEIIGPTSPTGADSKKYTQNPDGTWTNGIYTWNPATNQTSPNTPQDYSYNPATGQWDTTQWVYHPESGKYVPNVVSVAANPTAPTASLQPATLSAIADGSVAAPSFLINSTGPDSNNEINLGSTNKGIFDLFFNGSISNNIYSKAKSGDALVRGNTTGGSALTGDAEAIANVLNMLQSSWLGQSSDLATFVANLDGNLFGDLYIDPAALPYNLGVTNNDIDVNLSNNGVIDNNIDLIAESGDAGVLGNTTGGNATTGDAKAMANVINMINSAIHSGKSFLGMININGNYDGDILLPRGVLDALIASTGPNSNNTLGGSTTNNLNATTQTNRTINNTVDSSATTGDANVSHNTSGGTATSGQASTSTNTMNVVGQNVTGRNGLLVFVNVMGSWLGFIVSPTGAQISNTGPNSNNTIAGGGTNNVSVNATENSLINNDISVSAASGDATVANNTKGGNATTGNAQTSVNLLNMIGSNINVTDWFGVLFINVFGNWFGNFGSDTEHGGFSQNPTAGGMGGGSASSASGGGNTQVFSFIPKMLSNNNFSTATVATTELQPPASDDQNTQNNVVFGASTNNGSPTIDTSGAVLDSTQTNWWVVIATIGMAASGVALAAEYVLALRQERAGTGTGTTKTA